MKRSRTMIADNIKLLKSCLEAWPGLTMSDDEAIEIIARRTHELYTGEVDVGTTYKTHGDPVQKMEDMTAWFANMRRRWERDFDIADVAVKARIAVKTAKDVFVRQRAVTNNFEDL